MRLQVFAPGRNGLLDPFEGEGEGFAALAKGIGDLPAVRGEPAPQEIDAAAGAWGQGSAPVALLLIHDEDEVGGKGQGGVHLPAPDPFDVQAGLGHEPDGFRVGRYAVRGTQPRRFDLDAGAQSGLEEALRDGAPAMVAFA